MIKLNWQGIWESITKNKTKVLIGIGVLAVIAIGLWTFGGISDWWFKRGIEKQKEEIRQKQKEADAISEEIRLKELERARKLGEIEAQTKQLARDQEAANTAVANTDQAIENWKKAANANANSNVNAQQLEEILKKL